MTEQGGKECMVYRVCSKTLLDEVRNVINDKEMEDRQIAGRLLPMSRRLRLLLMRESYQHCNA